MEANQKAKGKWCRDAVIEIASRAQSRKEKAGKIWNAFSSPLASTVLFFHPISVYGSPRICQVHGYGSGSRGIPRHFWLPEMFFNLVHMHLFPGSSDGKESACSAGDSGSIPGSGRSPGEEMATHSSIPAWGIPGERSLAGYSPWAHKSRT